MRFCVKEFTRIRAIIIIRMVFLLLHIFYPNICGYIDKTHQDSIKSVSKNRFNLHSHHCQLLYILRHPWVSAGCSVRP